MTFEAGTNLFEPELEEFNRAVRDAADSLALPVPRPEYTRVLLAYNGTAAARAALQRIPAISSNASTITVITVVPFESVGSSLDPIKPEDRRWQWNCLVDAAAYLRAVGIEPFLEAAFGSPAAVIHETADSVRADLVVLGRSADRRWRPSLRQQRVRRSLQGRLTCDTLIVSERVETRSTRHG